MENHTQDLPAWAREGVDLQHPSVARIYDYLLGGYHNFEIDRAVARRSVEIYPDIVLTTQVNRAFLRRAVTFMSGQGVSQFIDIGSGIPTAGHVHEIARKVNPTGRVVYVDIDPVAIAHSKAIIGTDETILALQADARDPEFIFEYLNSAGILDLKKPVGLLMIALLHFIPDLEEARALIGRYTRHLAPGSYLAFTHGTIENTPPGAAEGIMKLGSKSAQETVYRRHDEIASIFKDLDFVEPGIVFTPLWRPESTEDLMLDEPGRSLAHAGIALLTT
jgi:hypothetical protein